MDFLPYLLVIVMILVAWALPGGGSSDADGADNRDDSDNDGGDGGDGGD